MKNNRHISGFTLVEMLVTVALVSVAMGITGQILYTTQNLYVEQNQRNDASRNGWMLSYRLSKELRESLPPSELLGVKWTGTGKKALLADSVATAKWPPASLEMLKAAEIFDCSISFPTSRATAPTGEKVPGVISYSLKRDAKDKIIGVVRKVKFVTLPDVAPTEEPISPAAVSLKFEFLDGNGQWSTEWAGPGMPRAVRATVGTLVRPSRYVRTPGIVNYATMICLPTDSRIPQ